MRRRRKACALTCCSAFVHSSHAYYTHQNGMPISQQISLEFVRRLSTTPITSPSSLAPTLTYTTALCSSTSNSCSTLSEKSIAWNKSSDVEIHLLLPTRASPRKEEEGQERRSWDEWCGSKMPQCRALHQSSALTGPHAQ